MIAKVVMLLLAGVVAAALIRALSLGRIEFGTGSSGLVADRKSAPRSFWLIFSIGLGVVALFGWLAIGA